MAIIRYWSALTSIAKVVDKHRRSALQGVHLVVIWSFLAIGGQEDILAPWLQCQPDERTKSQKWH